MIIKPIQIFALIIFFLGISTGKEDDFGNGLSASAMLVLVSTGIVSIL